MRPGKKKKVGNMTSKRNIWGTFILRPGILEIIYIYIYIYGIKKKYLGPCILRPRKRKSLRNMV